MAFTTRAEFMRWRDKRWRHWWMFRKVNFPNWETMPRIDMLIEFWVDMSYELFNRQHPGQYLADRTLRRYVRAKVKAEKYVPAWITRA